MPDRILRAGILTSDKVNQISFGAEVFYRRLMSVVDDYGRYDGRMAILRAMLYPLKMERAPESEVVKWLGECSKSGLIVVYQSGGKTFIEICNFNQRLRAKTSKWPQPADIRQSYDGHLLSNAPYSDTEAEAETDTEIHIVGQVVDFLNSTCGSQYKPNSKKTVTLIKTRISEGFSERDFKTVISKKKKEWGNTDMEKFLRPETLFGTKFEGYLNQPEPLTQDERFEKDLKDAGFVDAPSKPDDF